MNKKIELKKNILHKKDDLISYGIYEIGKRNDHLTLAVKILTSILGCSLILNGIQMIFINSRLKSTTVIETENLLLKKEKSRCIETDKQIEDKVKNYIEKEYRRIEKKYKL